MAREKSRSNWRRLIFIEYLGRISFMSEVIYDSNPDVMGEIQARIQAAIEQGTYLDLDFRDDNGPYTVGSDENGIIFTSRVNFNTQAGTVRTSEITQGFFGPSALKTADEKYLVGRKSKKTRSTRSRTTSNQ